MKNITEHWATVGFDSDDNTWTVSVIVDDDAAEHSTHETKKDAIEAAKNIPEINTVSAFTKGNSGMETHHC